MLEELPTSIADVDAAIAELRIQLIAAEDYNVLGGKELRAEIRRLQRHRDDLIDLPAQRDP